MYCIFIAAVAGPSNVQPESGGSTLADMSDQIENETMLRVLGTFKDGIDIPTFKGSSKSNNTLLDDMVFHIFFFHFVLGTYSAIYGRVVDNAKLLNLIACGSIYVNNTERKISVANDCEKQFTLAGLAEDYYRF